MGNVEEKKPIADEEKKRKEAERRLDEALRETFPASDPLAAGTPTGTEPLPHLEPRQSKKG